MRRLDLTLIVACLMVATAHAGKVLAQAPTPTPTQASPPARDAGASDVAPIGTSQIAGTVVDPERVPLRRVSVSISGTPPYARTVVTDDAGRFAFDALPAGRYTITAKKPGYPQMSYGATQPFRTGSGVVIAEGQQLTSIAMTLARGAVLEGVVYDEHGMPMPGIAVMPWEVRTSLSGERVFTSPRTGGEGTASDDRGMFRLFGLPPGEYTVGTAWYFHAAAVRVPSDEEIRAAFAATSSAQTAASSPNAQPPVQSPLTFAHSPVYHPDAVDPMLARTFTLAAGEERTGVDLRMQFRPMSAVEATIVDFDGTPATAEVSLFRRSRVAATNSTTISFVTNGKYRSPTLGPGEYALVAYTAASGDKPARSAQTLVSITGPEPVKVTLMLQPTPPVVARIAFEGETLAPPADLSAVRVSLSMPPGSYGNFNAMNTSTDASGVATIVGATPGRYRVTAAVPNQPATGAAWTLRSVIADGRDVTDLLFDVAAGAPPAIQVTFTDRTAELSGRLVQATGQPGTDLFVVVLPADRQYWVPGTRRITSARPDVSGRYLFRGLPAGEYRLAVTTELDTQDLSDTAALERLLAASEPVSIAVGEKKTLDIKLGSGGGI